MYGDGGVSQWQEKGMFAVFAVVAEVGRWVGRVLRQPGEVDGTGGK